MYTPPRFTFQKEKSKQSPINYIKKSNVAFLSLVAFIAFFIVAILDFFDSEFNYHDILVEFHGLVFDLIIFGILLSLYESIRNKNIKISNLLDELEDYRYWESEEALFRIRGIRSRLNQLGVRDINLSHCNLENEEFYGFENNKIESEIFIGANLKNTEFNNLDLTGTNFENARLQNAAFIDCILNNVNFEGAYLYETRFIECDFKNNNFLKSKIQNSKWFDYLRSYNNTGVDEIEECFTLKKLVYEPNEVYEFKKIKR